MPNALIQLLLQHPAMREAIGRGMATNPFSKTQDQYKSSTMPHHEALLKHPDHRTAADNLAIEEHIAKPKEEVARAERAWKARQKAEAARAKREAARMQGGG